MATFNNEIHADPLSIPSFLIASLIILPAIDLCWRLIFISTFLTGFNIWSLYKFVYFSDRPSIIRFVSSIVSRLCLVLVLLAWSLSMTPLHVFLPTFIDMWTPYSIREPQHATKVVYDFGDDAGVDIFAIHGLGSNPMSAWSYRTNDTIVHWLQDLLPDIPGFHDSRVVMVNHQTGWDSNAPHMELHEHASDLLERIEGHHKAHPHRPILFIAHSFGGLLLKKALLLAKQRSEDVATMTKGIVFLGVPHRGTEAAFLASCLSCTAFFRGSSSKLLDFMSVDGTALLELESEFYDSYVIQYRDDEEQPYIYDILEMRPERVGKLVLGSIARPKSGLFRHGRVTSVDTNHRGLNKFQSKDDPNFQIFARVLGQAREYAVQPRRPSKGQFPPIPPPSSTLPSEGVSENSPDLLDFALYSMPLTVSSLPQSAILAALQESAASWLARDRNKYGNYLTSRVPKASLGASIMGVPFAQLLFWILRQMFASYTPVSAKVVRLLFANLII
ncbi:Alpha/Beta hydrolase protein [Whalleya microplaca]|nr:Alpha/Beta hydrolase protein [Whalleya microplaca]